jgi:predicted PurR-regulated permease PerM
MNNLGSYLRAHWPPLVGLLIGSLIVAFFLYLHLRQKRNIVRWIARYVFRNQIMSDRSAESLFNVVTSFIAGVGGLWIILALYYLTNG